MPSLVKITLIDFDNYENFLGCVLMKSLILSQYQHLSTDSAAIHHVGMTQD